MGVVVPGALALGAFVGSCAVPCELSKKPNEWKLYHMYTNCQYSI